MVSPILANVYLHELDEFMSRMKANFDQGKYRQVNPDYRRLQGKIYRYRVKVDRLKADRQFDEAESIKSEIRILEKERRQIPAKNGMDPGYRRLLYSRYADDFLIGIIGSKENAAQVMATVKVFLEQTLQLAVSKEKSGIRKASEGALFLGYKVATRRSDRLKRTRIRGRTVTKRAPSDYIQLRAPVEKLAAFVEHKGYGNYYSLQATHRGAMIANSDVEIIMAYNAEMRGLASYYKLATLWTQDLGRVYRVWWFSLMKTLAGKHRTTVKRIARRLRDNDEHVIKYAIEGKPKLCKVFKLKHLDLKPVLVPEVDYFPTTGWLRGRSEIVERLNARECEACGVQDVPMQVHHVRRLADMKKAPLLKQVEAARRRKRVVLCHACHVALHQGTLHDMRKLE